MNIHAYFYNILLGVVIVLLFYSTFSIESFRKVNSFGKFFLGPRQKDMPFIYYFFPLSLISIDGIQVINIIKVFVAFHGE